ncbi:MAG: ATP-dependent DNA helicase RecG [Clostridia bacterium]|nr:ATP-dependent DNA helicase RecG [Clostridia bacterium]
MTDRQITGRNMDRPVTVLKGVGDARRDALAKLGAETLGDLIRVFPRAYQNRGDIQTLSVIRDRLKNGERGPFSAELTVSTEPDVRMVRRGMVLLKVRAFDETGTAELTYFNMPYMKNVFHVGETFRFFGRFTCEGSRVQAANPIAERVDEGVPLKQIVPVYPLVSGLTQKIMTQLVSEALRMCGNELTEYMPRDALAEMSMPTYAYTVTKIHNPETLSEIEAAKRRLMFDELYLTLLSMNLGQARRKKKNTCPIRCDTMDEFYAQLPFEMTGAQQRSVNEILADMAGDCLMNRILTGDVGSGKTIVAASACYAAVKSGYRAALMVPTEILANQHAEDFVELFTPMGIRCALLTGSTKKREKDKILSGLTDGQTSMTGKADDSVDIIIGTHALLSEGVEIDRLGLAVIDEQHRFGVMQRAALFEKGEGIHSLVMSATPIPRTLTLAAFGSLDVSRIDELPKGRQKIDTLVVNESYRERLNGFIRKQKEEGHQIYVVCPAVDEAEAEETDSEEMADIPFVQMEVDTSTPLKAATVFAEYLKEELDGLTVEYVHGKMKSAEREKIMTAFAAGAVDVLVSTTVIEVGVNVPNATLMIVENAERFGLSQLHQLRGRVGRGTAKSYFVLVSDSTTPESAERLRAIKSTSDGFRIAEYDLELRGPGDFFSDAGVIRQHGQMSDALTSACRDTGLIERASFYAKRTAQDDPKLEKPENRETLIRLTRMAEKSNHTVN